MRLYVRVWSWAKNFLDRINIVNISTKTYHSIVIVILFILTLGLYYQALSGFWRWDDGYIALHVFKHPGFDNFYVPNVWQKFSRAYLTPWIVFSFNLDLTLFGFSLTNFSDSLLSVFVLLHIFNASSFIVCWYSLLIIISFLFLVYDFPVKILTAS